MQDQLVEIVRAAVSAALKEHYSQQQAELQSDLAVSPGRALVLAGQKAVGRDGTIDEIEAAAYNQIHRDRFPFPLVRLSGGRRSWVVPVDGIRATLAAASTQRGARDRGARVGIADPSPARRPRGRRRKIAEEVDGAR